MKMKSLLRTSTAVLLPLTATAHPGHLDDAPVAHAFTHGVFYVAAAIGLALILARALRAARRSRR